MENRGIKKTKLGEILGKGKKESAQQKFLRASRFLNGTAEIKVTSLMKLVAFFEKPLEYFLGEEEKMIFSGGLASSEKKTSSPSKSWKEVEKNLRKLGLDETFIKTEIEKLKSKAR